MDAETLKLRYDLLVMETNEEFNRLLSKHKLIRFYDDIDEDEFDEIISNCDHNLHLIGFINSKNGNNEYYYISEVSEHGLYSIFENDTNYRVFKSYSDIDNILGKIELVGLMKKWSKE